MACDGNHRWPRLPDSRMVGHQGRREVWTCNNCLATKVVIETWQPDGSMRSAETVAEPADART